MLPTKSDNLAKQFQRKRFFRNLPNQKKNWLWRSCLSTDQDEFLFVLVHLAKWSQRRRLKCEKLTDDGCQVMTKALIR